MSPGRRKLDPAAIRASLGTDCPHCGARITPKQYKRVDGEHLQCPKCGRAFAPALEKARKDPGQPAELLTWKACTRYVDSMVRMSR